MRINHNIAALNASNRLGANDNAISKNLAKLSSGYRINSAADDAAGLAVSEKMRAQINGLNQAEDNAQNGISLVQTAEGGLNETQSILQRMNTLAVEAANGVYDSGTDLNNLNSEVTALKGEIDRISTATNFNGKTLLDGTIDGVTTFTSTGLTSASASIDGGSLAVGDILTVTISTSTVSTGSISATVGSTDVTFTSVTGAAGGTFTLTATVASTASAADKAKYTGLTITGKLDSDWAAKAETDAITVTKVDSPITFQIGSDNKNDQRVDLTIGDMSTKGLGIDIVTLGTQADAQKAIDTIKDANNMVSAQRANLGALQNRLEHTTNNLTTMSQNLTSAESTIRDVDMSSEMVSLTKNQILEQAATSMLAQANAMPQSVLSLLKG